MRTLKRRVDFLKSRDHKNSFDLAELGALEWAIVNLQPAPVQDTEAHYKGVVEGVQKLFDRAAAQPAVPDAFGTREGEHPQYVQGWNDCRAEMLKGMK
jgi:hypothetical protein